MEMSQQRVEGCSLEIGTQKQRQEGRALLCGGRGGPGCRRGDRVRDGTGRDPQAA